MNTAVKLKKAPPYRFAAFLLMLLPYILVYAGIQMVASLGEDIMRAFGIEAGSLSLLSSLGALSMAVLSVVAGGLSAKLGGKKVVMIGLMVMALSGVLYMLNTDSFAVLCLFRLVQGAGTGMVSACLMSLVCAWFPKNERGTAQGALGCFYGASISLVTVYAFACQRAGITWNMTAGWLLLGGGVILALLILVFYKDIEKVYGVSLIDEAIEGYEAESMPTDGAAAHETRFAKPHGWSEALRCPAFWIVGMTLFFYCACAFGTGFVVPMFLTFCGFEAAEATSIMSIGTLSSIIFALLGGMLSDKVFKSRRSEVSMIAFGGGAVLFLVMSFVGSAMSAAALTALYFVAYGFTYICAGPIWCLPAEIAAPEFAAQSMGACLLFSGVGGFVMTNVFGLVIQASSALYGMIALAVSMLMVFTGCLILKTKYKL